MKTRMMTLLALTGALMLAAGARADLVWDGSFDGISLYQEGNWTDDNSATPSAGEIDPGVVVTAATGGTIRIDGGAGTPSAYGGGNFSIGSNALVVGGGKTLASVTHGVAGAAGSSISISGDGTVDVTTVTGITGASSISGGTLTVDTGVSGSSTDLTVNGGGSMNATFMLSLDVSLGDGTITLDGAGDPVNATTVDFTSNSASLRFNNETPGNVRAEHLSKFTVNGITAFEDVNVSIGAFNGASGAEVTAMTDSYGQTVLEAGPGLYYAFNDTGNPVSDLSGNGNDGTVTGSPTFGEAGPINGALRLDGTGGLTTGFDLDVSTNSFSIEMLINPSGITGGDILVQQNDGAGLGRSLLLLNDNGSLNSFYGGSTQATTAAGLVNLGEWAHVVMTVEQNGAADVIKIYVNGVLVSMGTEDGEFSDGTWIIGAQKNGTANYDGLIDEAAFYSRVLSSDEVLAHARAIGIPTPAALPAGLGLIVLTLTRRKRRS